MRARTMCVALLAVIAWGAFVVPATADVLFAGFLSPPFRVSYAQTASDTVGYKAGAPMDVVTPTGTYVWTWTIECATSATSTGLRYWFVPAGWDTTKKVWDTLEPGTSYTWDVAPQSIHIRGITAATTYRIRLHMD